MSTTAQRRALILKWRATAADLRRRAADDSDTMPLMRTREATLAARALANVAGLGLKIAMVNEAHGLECAANDLEAIEVEALA